MLYPCNGILCSHLREWLHILVGMHNVLLFQQFTHSILHFCEMNEGPKLIYAQNAWNDTEISKIMFVTETWVAKVGKETILYLFVPLEFFLQYSFFLLWKQLISIHCIWTHLKFIVITVLEKQHPLRKFPAHFMQVSSVYRVISTS